MNTKIELKSINDLLKEDFFIPSFQRGYRWDSEQVNDLLDDLLEFYNKEKVKEEFYCLQPIVVTPYNSKFSVIDGQQRLTTIYIILTYLGELMKILGKTNFTIEFQTRKDSEQFLQEIDMTKREDNIDYHHICNALETVSNWFNSKDGTAKINLLNTLLNESGNNVQVIWYEVENTTDTDAIDIFTRINMGKIPLTNSELIKALFLRRDNFKGADEVRRLRQLEIAGEWDRIEHSLRDEEFWYFLQDGKTLYDNHIELVFNLMSNNLNSRGEVLSSDKYFTFRHFNERFNNHNDIEVAWREIKNYFQTFKQWFDNREYFHLVGYLVCAGVPIKTIKDQTENLTKEDFKKYLVDKVTEQVNCTISELTYDDAKPLLRKVLLLFNIVTILNNEKSNTRFQFGRYKTENWDIEHIHSSQSEMPETAGHQTEWMEEVIKFSEDEEIIEKAKLFVATPSNQRGGSFEPLYKEIVSKYSEEGKVEDINDISNLTLLDAGTNRGYKNAVFPFKRKSVIRRDATGTFIPICTKNVFLKYYSDEIGQMTFWGTDDRNSYKTVVVNTITDFLKPQPSI
ncbi:MAG: DUF262 domain-containing protein [Flavobacterium sp.]